MKTKLSYFEDTYQFTSSAIIIQSGQDEKGYFVLLDQTLFHPQGGGQPSDSGTITVDGVMISVPMVKNSNNEVRHYTDRDCSAMVTKTVECAINREKRLLHARLHTAGHLISNIVEAFDMGWRAVKGHHFPDQCYVEFTGTNCAENNLSVDSVNKEIADYLEKDCELSVDQQSADKMKTPSSHIPDDQPIRTVRIGDFPFSPCGGTHVRSLKELQGFNVTKLKSKNNMLKIYYQID